MEEIKVKEYVRTKYGEIGIITEVYPRLKWIKKINPSLLEYNEIKTHSLNLIDLIQCGDYVNGCEVLKKEADNYLLINDKGYRHLAPINICTIVTKEQIKAIEYRVKG